MGYRWVILAAGTLAQSSFAAASVGLPALGPALRSHYELSLGRTGVVLAAIGIGMLFTLLPWGLLADRFEERWVIATGLSGAGVVLVLGATTTSFVSLTLALIGAGALGASVNAASGRAIMSWFGARELGLALGIRQTAIPIGGALGAGLLPVLASAGGTRLAFFFLGGSCITGALVAAAFIRPGRARVPELTDVTRPLREPRLWLLGAGTGLYLTAQIGITGFVVLFLHEHRHVSIHAAAALLAGINVVAIAARIGSGQISDHLGTRLRPLRAIGIALAVATAAVAVLVDGPLAALIPAFAIAGVLSMSWNGLAFAAAAEAAGAARTGAALGFQQTLLGVVVAGFAPVFAVIVGFASWRIAFVLAALGPLLGVLALQRVREAKPRRDARTLEMSAIPPVAP
ncbi:MAG TPA: MFS transporter [Gaiellaceae bacterium]|nr:MFS transporter [Gaiellaceae bacterium]